MNQQLFPATIQGVKDFWNKRPCNIRHSPRPFGTKEYFDEVEQRKYFVEPHIPSFADFKRWKDKKILEIGCGIGTDSINFARAGAKLTAVELSEESLKVCKNRFAVFNQSAEFFTADAEHLQSVVPVQKCDLVYSFGVIHHSPRPEEIIKQIRSYMTKDSELRIMLYAKYSLKNFLIHIGLMQPEAQTGCPIANTYSAREVRRLLKGFKVTSIKKEHIFPYKIKEYKEYKYVKAFPWNILPSPLFHWLEKLMGWHLLICARLDESVTIN